MNVFKSLVGQNEPRKQSDYYVVIQAARWKWVTRSGIVNAKNSIRARSLWFLLEFCCFGNFSVLTGLGFGLPLGHPNLTPATLPMYQSTLRRCQSNKTLAKIRVLFLAFTDKTHRMSMTTIQRSQPVLFILQSWNSLWVWHFLRLCFVLKRVEVSDTQMNSGQRPMTLAGICLSSMLSKYIDKN